MLASLFLHCHIYLSISLRPGKYLKYILLYHLLIWLLLVSLLIPWCDPPCRLHPRFLIMGIFLYYLCFLLFWLLFLSFFWVLLVCPFSLIEIVPFCCPSLFCICSYGICGFLRDISCIFPALITLVFYSPCLVAFFFLHISSEWLYFLQNLHSVGFQS